MSAATAGAIYANDTSNITVLDSIFQGNGGGQGGAISLWNSSLLVNGTDFQGNIGHSAGASNVSLNLHLTLWIGASREVVDVSNDKPFQQEFVFDAYCWGCRRCNSSQQCFNSDCHHLDIHKQCCRERGSSFHRTGYLLVSGRLEWPLPSVLLVKQQTRT